ncbi:MAG: TonB-dependent receptor [Burkholderiaceae bacterium]|nr:TonB-dependent receptor [Burkholderiaceae bacterium]
MNPLPVQRVRAETGAAVVLVVALVVPALAFAQAGETQRELESVVVTATRSAADALNVPASVTVIEPGELELRNPTRLGDALADVPGLYVRGAALGNNFPGTGQGVLSLRGIPRTPRTLVMIDGQPVNNALTGGINVVGIPLDSVERVEVVRGPYSALYGGAAMGGVVNFITGSPDDPLTELRAGVGTLGQRGGAIVHRKRYDGGLGVSLSVAYRESDGDPDSSYLVKTLPRTAAPPVVPVSGVRPTTDPDGTPRYWVGRQGARPWSQTSAQLSLHYSLSPATKLAGGLGWADYSVGYSRPHSFLVDAAGAPVYSGTVSFDDAGTVRRLALAQTDWFTATPAGERDRRVFVRAEHRFDSGSELRAQIGTLQHNLFFAQADAGAAYDSGVGNLTDQPNRRIDAEASLRTPMSASWSLVGGVSLNRSTLDRQTRELSDWRDTDSRTALRNADGGRADNLALFVQSEHDLAEHLTAYVGGRYDRFAVRGRALQNVAPAFDERYEERSFAQFSPKLALVWVARPWVSLRTSYGTGFRPPSLFDLYGLTVVRTGGPTLVYEPSPALEPERVRAFEIGADLKLARHTRASVTLYRQRLEDLVYRRTLSTSTPMTTRTRAENVGEADVDGIEASVRWPAPVAGLHVFGALTHQFRYEIRRNDAQPEMVGRKLTDVPRTIWSAGIEYERGAWSGLFAARHVDHVFPSGDDLNRDVVEGVFGSYDRYTLFAARLGWSYDRHWRVSLAVDNLFDRKYFVSTRQPGRTVYAELAYRF